MTYSEFKATIQEIHTGAVIPVQIDNISKLVLGKLARLKLKTRIKIGELTVGSATSFNLDTLLPDFFALKPDAENKNRCIYYLQSTAPFFLIQTNHSRFILNTQGGFATLIGRILKVNFPNGVSVTTLFVPYYSKYLVANSDGDEKEKPSADSDVFLFDSIFDDVFVDGVLLYLKRRELSDKEFIKATQVWIDSLNSISFHQ